MVSRSVSIVISAWLVMAAGIFPLSTLHMVNAIVAGSLATLLSFAALSDNRARIGVAIVGAWVALVPFIFDSTMLEKVLTVSWGVTTFVHMIGPFSDPPRVEVVGGPVRSVPPIDEEPALPRAA